MGLGCDNAARVYAPPGHQPGPVGHGPWRDVHEHVPGRAKASQRGAWAYTHISGDDSRAAISHRRGAQDREATRREQVWCGLRPCCLEGGRRKKRGDRDNADAPGRKPEKSTRSNHLGFLLRLRVKEVCRLTSTGISEIDRLLLPLVLLKDPGRVTVDIDSSESPVHGLEVAVVGQGRRLPRRQAPAESHLTV